MFYFLAQLDNRLAWEFTDCPAENVLRLACGVRTGPQSTELSCGIASPLGISDFKFPLDVPSG